MRSTLILISICLLFIVFTVALYRACESKSPINANHEAIAKVNESTANKAATSSKTTSTNTGSSTTTTTTTTTTSGEIIGVAECDDFIAKYEACIIGKVPAEARAQWHTALAQWRTSWRQLAENPQTRSSLAQACKMAAEQSRTSMKPYGCDF